MTEQFDTNPGLLLLLPVTSYRVADFIHAAHCLDVRLDIVTNENLAINAFTDERAQCVDFRQVDQAVTAILDFHAGKIFHAVVGVDEATTLVASLVAKALGIKHNPGWAIETCHDKFLFRQAISNTGLLCPDYRKIDFEKMRFCADKVAYPCVLKPLGLSGSCGVIRVNNAAEFIIAAVQIQQILKHKNTGSTAPQNCFLCEDFITGDEIVVEGLLSEGTMSVLAIFDKPDSLNGPYFEETIYTTPSRLPLSIQNNAIKVVEQVCQTLELVQGPIHAELRINQQGCWIIEIAARSIGGHCSRALEFVGGNSLEQLILRQALEIKIDDIALSTPAAGVMMIPIEKSGILKSVSGMDAARCVANVTGLSINIPIGDRVEPLPVGDRYLGFIFSKAVDPIMVESALRKSHKLLIIDIN